MGWQESVQRVCKWRAVFAGWQLGTRAKGDPEADAVRDHRELSILLRVESSALVRALIEAKVMTTERWAELICEESDALSEAYEQKFPGMVATDDGISYDVSQARETMRGWKP